MLSFEMKTYPRISLIGNEIGDASWSLPESRIDDYQLVVVYHGNVRYILNKKVHILHKGDFLIVPPGHCYSAQACSDDGMKYYFIHFSPESAVKWYDSVEIREYTRKVFEMMSEEMSRCFWDLTKMFTNRIFLPSTANLSEFYEETATALERALYEKNKPSFNNQLMISFYIGQVFILISRIAVESLQRNIEMPTESQIPNLLQQVVYYIYGNYRSPLSVREIAEKFNVSQQYLSRLFNKYFGKSAKEYMNNVRINRAKELLKTTPMSVKEVSYAVGINDPLYFSRLFKKLVGITPSEFNKLKNRSSD
jgi:YesN/AraC family two-component response regulator